jgi:hypothetical protein
MESQILGFLGYGLLLSEKSVPRFTVFKNKLVFDTSSRERIPIEEAIARTIGYSPMNKTEKAYL